MSSAILRTNLPTLVPPNFCTIQPVFALLPRKALGTPLTCNCLSENVTVMSLGNIGLVAAQDESFAEFADGKADLLQHTRHAADNCSRY
jgi:hypothetical protein